MTDQEKCDLKKYQCGPLINFMLKTRRSNGRLSTMNTRIPRQKSQDSVFSVKGTKSLYRSDCLGDEIHEMK